MSKSGPPQDGLRLETDTSSRTSEARSGIQFALYARGRRNLGPGLRRGDNSCVIPGERSETRDPICVVCAGAA
jgi:hypothetical protein